MVFTPDSAALRSPVPMTSLTTHLATPAERVGRRLRRPGVGVGIALLSAASFATSGAIGRSMLDIGWSPGAVIVVRIGLAAVVLLLPTGLALRGRWRQLRRNAGLVLAYGVLAVAGVQLAYFSALQTLSVGVALLIEYLAPVLIVGWTWARTGRPPSGLTTAGAAFAIVGLILVLDITGEATISVVGIAWALVAAVGLAGFFVLGGRDDADALPPIALTGAGLVVGALALGAAGLVGVLPMRATASDVVLAGNRFPWWVAALELALVAGAGAYVLAVLAVRRLGATVSSFIGLTEVLFATVVAWALLDQQPGAVQLLGGAFVLVGVIAVRVGETRRAALDAIAM